MHKKGEDVLLVIYYVINAAIIAISLFLFFLSNTFDPRNLYDGVGDPSFWPKCILVVIMIIAVASIISEIIKQKKGIIENTEKGKINYKKLVLAVSLSCLYAFSLEYLGFIISTLLFQFLFLLLQGVKKVSTLILTPFILTTLIYVIFVLAMSIVLPRGVGIFRSLSLLLY